MADAYKDFSQIPPLGREPPKEELDRRTHPYHERTEKVVGGQIKWKPIDQVAARVVAPAKWWARPPEPQPRFMKKPVRLNFEEKGQIHTKRGLTEDGHVEELISRSDLEPVVIEHREKEAKKILENLQTLQPRAQDIHDSLDYLLSHIAPLFETVNEGVSKELVLLREKRFALDTETRLLMNQLKEVRQFFLDDAHDRQVDRLREFNDLCERLAALKSSGFLDAIADTILKL